MESDLVRMSLRECKDNYNHPILTKVPGYFIYLYDLAFRAINMGG